MVIRSNTMILDRKIYSRKSQRGWAIVIMPDNIRIDNFHSFSHAHFPFEKKHQKIKYDNFDIIMEIVSNHILLNKGVNLKVLKEELI